MTALGYEHPIRWPPMDGRFVIGELTFGLNIEGGGDGSPRALLDWILRCLAFGTA